MFGDWGWSNACGTSGRPHCNMGSWWILSLRCIFYPLRSPRRPTGPCSAPPAAWLQSLSHSPGSNPWNKNAALSVIYIEKHEHIKLLLLGNPLLSQSWAPSLCLVLTCNTKNSHIKVVVLKFQAQVLEELSHTYLLFETLVVTAVTEASETASISGSMNKPRRSRFSVSRIAGSSEEAKCKKNSKCCYSKLWQWKYKEMWHPFTFMR